MARKYDEIKWLAQATAQIDMLRQTNATLLIENLKIGNLGIEVIGEMLKGKISREDYQKMLKEKYKANGKYRRS